MSIVNGKSGMWWTGVTAVAAVMAMVSSVLAAPKIGEKAPDFELRDQSGKVHKLSDYAGKVVVLEWTCGTCPAVKMHYKDSTQTMNKLWEQYKDKNVVWLLINSSKDANQESNAKMAQKWNISRPVLDDASGATGKAFGARTTPHMFVVDAAGNLAYNGAIDDGPGGEATVNYVDKALGELLAQKSVSTPETKPYGCGVKYAK
jgi:peroxiredoxin